MNQEALQARAGEGGEIYTADGGHMKIFLIMSFAMLSVGGIYGTLQSFDKMGLDLYDYLPPGLRGLYYLGLTVHGVTLALLFTTYFIIPFLNLAVIHGLRRPLASRALARLSLWLGIAGFVMTLIPIFLNQATVLWTFYAPLRAHPLFYGGLALVVVATWTTALNAYLTWRAWKREHPGERTPLMAFASLATWAMWVLASLGIAVAALVYLLPWSLGIRENVNPLLTRALYWFTGHPLVYFWLLPTYVAWYTMLPAQVGGRLFSESLARLVFLLFIPLAVPTGFHHMYTDPGVHENTKIIHAVLTFAVIFPSLITAFTVVASVEDGARRSGGKGLLAWLLALPWLTNPSAAGQLLAMLVFATGGITGLINATFTMNLVVHNTLWVPGHLHTQVAGAVTLTFMAISYWFVPLLTGRALWGRRLAVLQVWLWFFGMLIMARGMHWMGIAGVPRRTYLSQAPYANFTEWNLAGMLVGWGGFIITVSGLLFFVVMIMTAFASKAKAPAAADVPESKPLHHVERMPLLLDRISPWVLVSAVLIAIAWLPSLYTIATTQPLVPGWNLW